VVGKVLKQEVEDLTMEASGCPKGSTGFFAVYQKVLSNYVTETLTEEDREKYREMAREWTERSPPEAVQQEWVCPPIFKCDLIIIKVGCEACSSICPRLRTENVDSTWNEDICLDRSERKEWGG
jgi:hypothetical protein